MSAAITHSQALDLAETALKGGVIASFSYLVAAHVLHRMASAGTRQIMLSATDMHGRVLLDKSGRIAAGDIAASIHAGFGRTTAGSGEVSPLYIAALQELHWNWILFSDLREVALDASDYRDTHFTLDTKYSPGVHWRESTPVVFRLPNDPLDTLVRALSCATTAFDAPQEKMAVYAD